MNPIVLQMAVLTHSRRFETFLMNLSFFHDDEKTRPSKISGNVGYFSFCKHMYLNFFCVKSSA